MYVCMYTRTFKYTQVYTYNRLHVLSVHTQNEALATVPYELPVMQVNLIYMYLHMDTHIDTPLYIHINVFIYQRVTADRVYPYLRVNPSIVFLQISFFAFFLGSQQALQNWVHPFELLCVCVLALPLYRVYPNPRVNPRFRSLPFLGFATGVAELGSPV